MKIKTSGLREKKYYWYIENVCKISTALLSSQTLSLHIAGVKHFRQVWPRFPSLPTSFLLNYYHSPVKGFWRRSHSNLLNYQPRRACGTIYFSVMGHTGQIGRSKWTIQVTWMNRAIIKSCCIPRQGGKEQFSGKSADLFVCFRLLFTYAMEKFSRHTAQKCEIICGIFKLFLSVDISRALKLIQMLTSLPWHMGLIFKTTFPGQ